MTIYAGFGKLWTYHYANSSSTKKSCALCTFDLSILRRTNMPNNTAPHDWHNTHDEQHEQPPYEQTPTHDLHQHRCPYCADTFATHRAVRTHMRFTHDTLHTVWQCVTAPICPYCSTHFADKISAVQHVMKSIIKKRMHHKPIFLC